MNKVTFKAFFIIFYIATAVCVVLQTIIKLFAMEPSTGFYSGLLIVGSSTNKVIQWLPLILLILIAGLAVGFWFLVTSMRKARHDYALNYKHSPTSVFSIITGLAIIAFSVLDTSRLTVNKLSTPFSQKIGMTVVVVLGIVAGISMIVGGAQSKYGRYGKPGAFLGIFPALWQTVVLFKRFNNFFAVTTVADTLMNIFFMCAAIMFLLGQSRIVYGLGIRNGKSYAFPTGLTASLVGFTLVVPNIIYMLVNGQPMHSTALTMSECIYILSLSVYVPVFLNGFSKSIHTV